MRIGIDLDNTIICYDRAFYDVASELGLIPTSVGRTKQEVKVWIQRERDNDVWTELQGEVYGNYLHKAESYPGALEFTRRCLKAGHQVRIESHKTRFPAIGKPVDLRVAALNWLEQNGFFGADLLSVDNVGFHDSRANKVAAISSNNYEVFIDDLPEVFQEPGFPGYTTRILFDPNKTESYSTRYFRISNWSEVDHILFANDLLTRETGIANQLLKSANLPEARMIVPLQGGRNNKVFRVGTSAGDILLKSYFHDSQDKRDRLGQEFAFLNHMARLKSSFCPEPLAFNAEEHLAILEFIEGDRLRLDQISERHIDHATAFILEANRDNEDASTALIPNASEACFSIAQHLECTQKRVDRLSQILLEDSVDDEARNFVDTELIPLWKATRASIEQQSVGTIDQELPERERCLSPSDFGFHNTLQQDNGAVRFLDFEYAGWDDPAKLIIDFANQPDMLLEKHLSQRFREVIIAKSANPSALEKRVALLEPLYQIKWACICLNVFLAAGRRRLQFTDGTKADHQQSRIFQLSRARVMLSRAANRE